MSRDIAPAEIPPAEVPERLPVLALLAPLPPPLPWAKAGLVACTVTLATAVVAPGTNVVEAKPHWDMILFISTFRQPLALDM